MQRAPERRDSDSEWHLLGDRTRFRPLFCQQLPDAAWRLRRDAANHGIPPLEVQNLASISNPCGFGQRFGISVPRRRRAVEERRRRSVNGHERR